MPWLWGRRLALQLNGVANCDADGRGAVRSMCSNAKGGEGEFEVGYFRYSEAVGWDDRQLSLSGKNQQAQGREWVVVDRNEGGVNRRDGRNFFRK